MHNLMFEILELIIHLNKGANNFQFDRTPSETFALSIFIQRNELFQRVV